MNGTSTTVFGMDVFAPRLEPTYSRFRVDPKYAENRHILKWWLPAHDGLLATLIDEKRWIWYWYANDEIVKHTDANRIEEWKKSDPLCRRYAWYNVLMYFAAARAERLGITKNIRGPKIKRCLLCEHEFSEDSLPVPLIERLGVDELDFCAPCLSSTVYQGTGDNAATRTAVLAHLKCLSEVIGRVPPQSFGEGVIDLRELDRNDRVALLKLFRKKPTTKRVKALFGSWLNALIKAGVLEHGTRKTSRGVQTLAVDGHVCFSLGEKTIDDFLHRRGIRHVREPQYPEGRYRGDFKVGEVLIEYFGLAGDAAYDKKIQEKKRICDERGISLIAIYAQDLMSQERLEAKLLPLTGNTAANMALNRTRQKQRAG